MTYSIAVLLAVAGFGAVLGGTVVWLVMAWRDLGPTKVREKPRMVELPPTKLISIDYERPSKALDIARTWNGTGRGWRGRS